MRKTKPLMESEFFVIAVYFGLLCIACFVFFGAYILIKRSLNVNPFFVLGGLLLIYVVAILHFLKTKKSKAKERY